MLALADSFGELLLLLLLLIMLALKFALVVDDEDSNGARPILELELVARDLGTIAADVDDESNFDNVTFDWEGGIVLLFSGSLCCVCF